MFAAEVAKFRSLSNVCANSTRISLQNRVFLAIQNAELRRSANMKNDIVANGAPAKTRKPWIIPAATDALEPQDIANSYQLHQDANPHAVNDAS